MFVYVVILSSNVLMQHLSGQLQDIAEQSIK